MVFPPVFIFVYLAHLTLLRLPYYWDEAGYYIPAAYDFFRTGTLIPYSTLSNAHPPLPSIYLALWWKASGFTPAVTRTAMCLISALALTAVYRICQSLTGRATVAAATVLLTAIYPIWFAQSTLAHADMFAAAATLWAFVYLLPARDGGKHLWAAIVFFSVAALCKETAIATPAALAVYEAVRAFRTRASNDPTKRRSSLRGALLLLIPVLPLAAWYAWHYHRTGYIFGNPTFLRYNATANLSPVRILLALWHRTVHLTIHMNLFVPVLLLLAALFLPPRTEEDGTPRPRVDVETQARMAVILVANLVFFSVMGGALLTRYLLPLYPLVLLFCVSTWRRRVPYWPFLVWLTAAAFITGLFVRPPYPFASEDNLAYRDAIVLQQRAIRQIIERYPHATVLTAWPVTDELSKPELGYVHAPIPVVRLEDFTLPQIQRAAQSTEAYSVALLFSTKDDPPHSLFGLGPRPSPLDTRYFDFHHDVPPAIAAHLLGGEIVWQASRGQQWVAVVHFNRPQLAGFDLACCITIRTL